MPCRVDDWDEGKRKLPMETVGELEAVLCGMMTALEEKVVETGLPELQLFMDRVDWKEVGVRRGHVEGWWAKHKAKDEKRRKEEEAARKREEKKKKALSKLTAEERKLLGIG